MPTDDCHLRGHLAQQERILRELEVVEAAEHVLRSHYRGLLTEELAALGRELADARRQLAAIRQSGDPSRVAIAHSQVCAVENTTRILGQLKHEHEQACTRARTTYLAAQRQVLDIIRGLHCLIVRTPPPPAIP